MSYSQIVLVDSNIFISSLDKAHPNYKKAVSLLERCSKFGLKPAVSDLILSEVATFLIHSNAFDEVEAVFEYVKSDRIEVVPFETKVFLETIKLIKEGPNRHISFCDYYSTSLIRSSKRFYKNGIISFDEHFKGVRLFIDIS